MAPYHSSSKGQAERGVQTFEAGQEGDFGGETIPLLGELPAYTTCHNWASVSGVVARAASEVPAGPSPPRHCTEQAGRTGSEPEQRKPREVVRVG